MSDNQYRLFKALTVTFIILYSVIVGIPISHYVVDHEIVYTLSTAGLEVCYVNVEFNEPHGFNCSKP